MSITAHTLVESVIKYGLTLTGASTTAEDLGRLDTSALNPIKRRVPGVGYSIRRHVLFALADVRSVQNHYLLKVADVMDRVLRASSTQAEANFQKYLKSRGGNLQAMEINGGLPERSEPSAANRAKRTSGAKFGERPHSRGGTEAPEATDKSKTLVEAMCGEK